MRRRINFLISTPAFQVAAPLHAQAIRLPCTGTGGYAIAFGEGTGSFGGTHDFDGVLPQHVGLNCIQYFQVLSSGQPVNTNLGDTGADEASLTRHARTLSCYRGATWFISAHRPSTVEATVPTIWSLFQTAGDGWRAATPRPGHTGRRAPTATMASSTWPRM